MKMRRASLGCFSLNGVIASLVVLLVVVGVGLLREGVLFSPGGLNAQAAAGSPVPASYPGGIISHAATQDCAACHTPFWSARSMDDACLACHTDVTQQPKNFHKVLFAQPGQSQNCRACHTEHHGPTGALTRASLASFPHATTGYSLKAHQTQRDGTPFACGDCHKTYRVFDQAVCTDCHKKLDATFTVAHVAAYGSVCTTCHDGVDSYGKTFDHHKVTFDLLGKHAALTCDRCHQGARSVADLKNTPSTCAGCHAKDDAHQGQFGQDCGACHKADGWKPAAFDHASTSFALIGRHAAVACQACHTNSVFKGTPVDCYSCHSQKDAHQGRFGRDCSACHTPDGWKPATFDHATSAFPLVGKHQAVACQGCHGNSQFKGTPTTCVACHAKNDAHKGGFGQACEGCHSPTAWKPATFDHAKTNFPLTGAHVSLACGKCHTKDASGNLTFKGVSTNCASCHADPPYHKGLFGTDCASCHATIGWSPAKFNGAHNNFPVNHGGAATCQACHPQSLAGYTCFSCHNHAQTIQRHQDEGITNISNCVSCHAGGRGSGG